MSNLPKYFYFRVRATRRGTAIEVEDASDCDVVEVVRCKDCKHIQHDTLFGQYWCNGRKVTAEWYCGDAERRNDETD